MENDSLLYSVNNGFLSETSSVDYNLTNFTTRSPPAGDFELVRNVVFYALAFIIPIGIVANCLAFVVISSSYMCRSTTGHYLLSLALADTTILLGELLLWLNSRVDKTYSPKMGITFVDTIDFWCHFVNYIRYSGRLWSSWVTVIITAERYITIAFPLRVWRISTPWKAKIVIIVEIVVSFMLSSFVWFTLGAGEHNGTPRCLIIKPHAYKILSIIIMGFGELVIPSLIVCIFTALIIRKLAQAMKNRRLRQEGQRIMRVPTSVSQEKQLTYILLAVAITFVLIRLPYVVTFYINEYKEETLPHLTDLERFYIYAANKIANVLSVVNYCINFFLYCLCGSTFRRQLKRVVRCKKRKDSNATKGFSTMTVISKDLNSSNSSMASNTRQNQWKVSMGPVSSASTYTTSYKPGGRQMETSLGCNSSRSRV